MPGYCLRYRQTSMYGVSTMLYIQVQRKLKILWPLRRFDDMDCVNDNSAFHRGTAELEWANAIVERFCGGIGKMDDLGQRNLRKSVGETLHQVAAMPPVVPMEWDAKCLTWRNADQLAAFDQCMGL